MVKATIPLPPRSTLTLDGFLRELTAGCRELPRMFGLPPIEEHLGTELSYAVVIRADMVVRLVDGRILNTEWQTSHKPELGRRLVDTYRGIEQNHGPAVIVQHVLRLDQVEAPAPIIAAVAGQRVTFAVSTPADMDLEPLFASPYVNDRIMACLLTTEPERLVAVAGGLGELPEDDRLRALKLFGLMTQFRMDRNELPREVLEMVTDVIEIDHKRNPVTRGAWREERMRSVLRLMTLFGTVDDDERKRIAELDADALASFEDELFAKVEERFPAEDTSPHP